MQQPEPHKRGYANFSPLGIPYFAGDVEVAVDSLKRYLKYPQDPDASFRIILAMNESVVNRCGVLTTFSGMFIAICLFITTRPEVLPHIWQQSIFYILLFLWSVVIVRLMWSLRHTLPQPWQFGTESDLEFTAKLYFYRMRRYNETLLLTCICYILILFSVAPVSTQLADVLFHKQADSIGKPNL